MATCEVARSRGASGSVPGGEVATRLPVRLQRSSSEFASTWWVWPAYPRQGACEYLERIRFAEDACGRLR